MRTISGGLPPVPKGWTPPEQMPHLGAAKRLSIDVETFDPGLAAKMGPAYKTGGYIAGLAVGTDDGRRWYFPMRHEAGAGMNLDPDMVMAWAQEELARTEQPKVGANLMYDISYLHEAGVEVRGELHDVLMADPLLDEYRRRYSLNASALWHLGEGKPDDAMYQWGAAAFGGSATRKAQVGNIWRMHPAVVGPYAEGDVDLPLRIADVQKAKLEAEGLWDVYRMECDLLPVIVGMKARGVRVDVGGAERLSEELGKRLVRDQAALEKMAGGAVDVNTNADLVKLFDRLGIEYPYTEPSKTYPNGQPSFPGPWLQHHTHPVTDLIVNVRKWDKNKGTFADGYVRKYAHNGRIYADFHQLPTGENGAVSGRFSSSGPNLQNIPARDPEMKELLRGLFLPDEGHLWGKIDQSQIEYRFMVHFAAVAGFPKAAAMCQEFIDDPETDYHSLVAEWTELPRKQAKGVNFGTAYAQGKAALAAGLGWTPQQAERFLDMYHTRMPFISMLLDKARNLAETRGHVRTIMGRRARFNKWEPARWPGKGDPAKWTALAIEEAREQWPGERIKRAFCYAAMNRVMQGSSADMLKMAMLKMYNAGVFAPDALGFPLLTVHDEMGFSVPQTPTGALALVEAQHIMETALTLRLPVRADIELGPNWGAVVKV